ncbi:MAG: endo alpha-1,4 polygalactosaminidase [Anaerolineae bacterium]
MLGIRGKIQTMAFYYGGGRLPRLTRYAKVVLQPCAYTPEEIGFLLSRKTQPLTYLSLGEDHLASAPWHRKERNAVWNTAYVDLAHPDWIRTRLDQAQRALEAGFQGLFLDTLDTVTLYPEDRKAFLGLVEQLRHLVGQRLLYANRGFHLMPELARLVDGVVLESFSTTWTPWGYRMLSSHESEYNLRYFFRLLEHGLEIYALDYGDRFWLEAYAKLRAAFWGLPTFVSNRDLTRI